MEIIALRESREKSTNEEGLLERRLSGKIDLKVVDMSVEMCDRCLDVTVFLANKLGERRGLRPRLSKLVCLRNDARLGRNLSERVNDTTLLQGMHLSLIHI